MSGFGNAVRVRRLYANGSFASQVLAAARAVYRPRKTILFFPERPPFGAVELALCALLGHAITADPRRTFDVAFKRQDATFSDAAILRSIPTREDRIVNARSTDISKRFLARAFADAFGYELEVDPTRHEGVLVEKSNLNSAHDGRIRTGPVPPAQIRPGCVYEKFIDSVSEDPGFVLDYRLPVYGDETPLLYLKYRPGETRFSNLNARVTFREPAAVFSAEELASMVRLARRMGIDYGEFDVLRDRDGRLYVVDANSTPSGPPNGLPLADCRIALDRLARSFDRLLDRCSAKPASG